MIPLIFTKSLAIYIHMPGILANSVADLGYMDNPVTLGFDFVLYIIYIVGIEADDNLEMP